MQVSKRNASKSSAVAAFLILSVSTLYGATCTAVSNGNWASGSTWSCGRAPAAGDILVIPVGRTVTVTTNITYSGSLMRIRVYGHLFFNGGGAKISLPCNSIVEAMTPTAQISGNGGGSSQTIKICNTTYWSASNGPVNGYSAWPDNATLPVELVYFKGESTNGQVDLKWSTASETNCDRYRVERSEDDAQWTPIGEVEGAGNSLFLLTYTLSDVPGRSGIFYYRLLQFDLDGTEQDLGKVAVQAQADPAITCYPNPTSGSLRMIVGSPGGVLELIDPKGVLVTTFSVQQTAVDLDLSTYTEGIYLIRYTHQEAITQRRAALVH